MKCLVTGADGFIGSHLVESLHRDGIPVRSLVQPSAGLANLRPDISEIVYGDIRDLPQMRRISRGMDVVYHLAAISRYDLNVPEAEYHRTNVEGTRNILEAAREAGVKRVLFTGTIEAVGLSGNNDPLTEETPQFPRNIYGRSKLEGEELVRSCNAPGVLETVVVRPPMTYGPGEVILCQRLFRIIQRGVYPLVGSGRTLTEFCYVKNLVQGIRLAAERGQPGEVYFISDERSYTIEEVVRSIAGELGVKVITPHLPIPAAYVLGYIFEILGGIFRFYPFLIPQTGRPPFSRKTVEWTSESRLYCDISKAKRELGYRPPYTLVQGLRETIRWYRERGYLA